MTEQATVLRTAGKIAIVAIDKKPQCAGCKMCAFRAGATQVRVRAVNTAGAKAGERVVVHAERDRRALASLIVYILPVLFAGIGVAVGALALGGELWAACLCLAGLAVGLGCVFGIDRALSLRRGFGMEVVEVLHTHSETNHKEEIENGQHT